MSDFPQNGHFQVVLMGLSVTELQVRVTSFDLANVSAVEAPKVTQISITER